jgi:hypothetical protein
MKTCKINYFNSRGKSEGVVRHFLKSGKSEGEFFFPDLEIYRSLQLDGKSSKSFSHRKDRPQYTRPIYHEHKHISVYIPLP